VKFTKSPEKAKEHLILIELRTDPTTDEPPQWNGIVEICGPNTNGVYESLGGFITDYMKGTQMPPAPHCDAHYHTPKLRLKPCEKHESGRYEGFMNGESNLGKWTMRICDFMVDHLGEWDLLVCNSDNLSRSFRHGSGDNAYFNSVTAREMQMVFRHRPRCFHVRGRREAFGPASVGAPALLDRQGMHRRRGRTQAAPRVPG